MLLANRDILMKTLEIMHGVCVRDHLEDGLFPHDSDEHP